MKISEVEALRRLRSANNLSRLAAPRDSASSSNTNSPLLRGRFDESLGKAVESGSDSPIAHEKLKRGRGHVFGSAPEFIRDVIGDLASMPGHESQEKIGEVFGISAGSVSTYKNGTSNNGKTPERAAKAQARQDAIKDVALTKLMSALQLCDEEKLADLSAKELGRFANDMSRVVTSVSPSLANASPVNLIIYSPESRPESKYQVIDVD